MGLTLEKVKKKFIFTEIYAFQNPAGGSTE
jgi:hypothetical protein